MAKADFHVPYGLPYSHGAVVDTPLLVVAGESLLYSWNIKNNVAAVSYVQVFDKATAGAVTLGTTVADYVIANAASAVLDRALAKPLHFVNGIVIASTNSSSGLTAASQDVCMEYA